MRRQTKDDRPAQFEADRLLRRAAKRYQELNKDVPDDVKAQVLGHMMAGIQRQHIAPGENLPQMFMRLCPHVHAVAASYGYQLDLELPENDNANLAWGKVFYVLRRQTRH